MFSKFQEIFDQLKDTLAARWEQFQETETYQSLKERYDTLSPIGQKLAIGISFFLVSMVFLMIPWGWYSVSQDNVTSFEDTKYTINELLEVSQESKSLPPQSMAMAPAEVKSRIDKIVSEKGLSKEQMAGVNERQFANPKGSTLIPANVTQNGIEVSLKKLNLKQAIDIGYEIERVAPTVKILGIDIRANATDDHYYDVNYLAAGFSVNDKKEDTSKKKKR